MFGSEPDALLQKSLGRLPQVLCARNLRHDIDDLVKPILPARPAVVFDHNTGEALGERICRALKAVPVLLAGNPAADMETVDYVRREAAECAGLVAVGGGTINDICKYASFADGKPYVVFPTAASMNGYLSANASIAVEGYKTTLPARMPEAVFCDLSVIAGAPVRLSRSGLGDSLARPTAQADWLLSHLLLGTAYDETPFALLKPFEPHLFENARGIGKGDMESIEALMKVLLLSGLGMTIAGGSYPASQGEHMVAHAMEMLSARHSREGGNPGSFHGEEIGVTTLAVSKRQEALLRKKPTLLPLQFPTEILEKLWEKKAMEEADQTYKIKLARIIENDLDSRLRGNDGWWESIAARIESIMLPSASIQAILKAADAPGTPEALGWDMGAYATAMNYARFLRDRFTFLDLE
ncbi:MAG: iron-containing alcohol dehydrogenase [Pseudomonadota bacterium]|nr:iron-containing alcohol dehydrogenase [Pseudomonadota bacterium]MDE3038133.1 iron-containing alcohol dehydrogenase [Pseudomonadota bacterium]